MEKNDVLSTNFIEHLEKKIVSGDFMELISPWQLQQAIDTSSSGSLNYSGTSTIRECLGMTFPDPSAMEGQHVACTEDGSRTRKKIFSFTKRRGTKFRRSC